MEITNDIKNKMVSMINGLLGEGGLGTSMTDAVDFGCRFWGGLTSRIVGGNHEETKFLIEELGEFLVVNHETREAILS